jgi:hypothetical protein
VAERRTKPYRPHIGIQVVVPLAEYMDDETFIKHLEKRHAQDTGVEGYMTRHNVTIWVGMYRTFHERCHRVAHPGQYDHIHEEQEEDDE